MLSDRREFIKRAFTGVLALFGIGFIIPAARVLTPSAVGKKRMVFFPLMPEEDIPRRGVKKAELSYPALGREMKARVFVVSSSRGMRVFSSTCTHLGCLVNYRRDKQEFICPCHGGRYDLSGKNIAGPPPAPLTRFPIRIQDGTVYIGMKV